MKDRTRVVIDIRWFAPLVLVAIGAFFAELREPVQIVWPLDNKLYGPLLAQVIAAAAYLVFELVYATKRETTTSMLQADGFLATIWAIAMTGAAVWLYRDGTLWWCMLVPTFAAWLDALLPPMVALNNAAQKPLVEGTRTHD